MTAAQPGMSHQPTHSVGEHRRSGRMEQIINAVASGLGNTIGWLAGNGVLFVVFALIWAAFAFGLIWSQGSIDQAWETIRGLPLIVQAVVWLLLLPVMAGLWVWETTWPFVVRLVLVLSLAGWNLLVFLPRAAQAARP